MEGKEWIWDNGVLKSITVENYKSEIEKTKREQNLQKRSLKSLRTLYLNSKNLRSISKKSAGFEMVICINNCNIKLINLKGDRMSETEIKKEEVVSEANGVVNKDAVAAEPSPLKNDAEDLGKAVTKPSDPMD